jgi:hypothetical protein
MTILPPIALVLLVFQDPPAPAPPFRASMTIERYVRREDRVAVEVGTLTVRPGVALMFESRARRLLLRDGKSHERRSGERYVRIRDLAVPGNFQPLELWGRDARWIRERFREVGDPGSEARPLPASVVTGEGRAVPPVNAVPPEASLAHADGGDLAEGCRRVILVPRDPSLRARLPSIRLSVDRRSGRILSAVLDGATQILTLTLGDYTEDPAMGDGSFEMDLSNVKVEDR